MNLPSVLSSIEQEGIPEEAGRGSNKWIEKVGTQFCIRTDGVDPNLGCWPSKEKAEAVMAGKSFIEPDVPKNLLAGGPGSGRKKEAMNAYQRTYALAKQAGYEDEKAHDAAVDSYIQKFKSMKAGGVGSGRKPSIAKGLNKWKSRDQELKDAAKDPKQRKLPLKAVGPPMIKFKVPSPFKTPQQHGTKSAPSAMNKVSGPNHRRPNPPFKEMEATDWGEPNAGAYQHAHMDTNMWFHPPSARNTKPTPTDDPMEKDDSLGDVTKRNSKDTKDQRMKLLKRSTPGGTPPVVPVRTTLISPTLNTYMPMQAAAHRIRRRNGGGNFRSLNAAKL